MPPTPTSEPMLCRQALLLVSLEIIKGTAALLSRLLTVHCSSEGLIIALTVPLTYINLNQ